MAPHDDDTVRLRAGSVATTPPRRGSRRLFVGCAICAGVAAGGGFGWTLFKPSAAPKLAPAATPSAPAVPPIAVTTASEAAILANHTTTLDVFRFDRNPRILVLDFASLARQGAMLNRVAAMIEKNGQPHDRALDDAALDIAIRANGDTPETFYYGHDYGSVSLTRFFAAVSRQNIKLTDGEAWLRDLLQQQTALVSGGTIGLISVPALDEGGVTLDMRATILHHELSHGEFFTNAAYAAWTREFWTNVLDGPSRTAFRGFLVSQDYDPSIEELLANEAQAYLMFTPSPHFFRPDLVGMTEQAVGYWRQRFRDGMPPGWLRDQALRDAKPL